MALRYLPLYDENGDVIDPAFFVEGAADFAGEIDGGLDRDNFAANDLVTGEIDTSAGRVFNISPTNTMFNTEDNFPADMDVTGWQNGSGTTTGTTNLGILSWTADQDAHYDIHWSGGWIWNGTYSWNYPTGAVVGARPNRTDTFDTMRLRVTVDGVSVCMAGPFEDGMLVGATYMVGSIQLPAGTHTLKVECQVVRRIAQNGEEAGQCINTVTFNDRTIVALGRIR